MFLEGEIKKETLGKMDQRQSIIIKLWAKIKKILSHS